MSDVKGAIKLPMRPVNDEMPIAWLLQFVTRTICRTKRLYGQDKLYADLFAVCSNKVSVDLYSAL